MSSKVGVALVAVKPPFVDTPHVLYELVVSIENCIAFPTRIPPLLVDGSDVFVEVFLLLKRFPAMGARVALIHGLLRGRGCILLKKKYSVEL